MKNKGNLTAKEQARIQKKKERRQEKRLLKQYIEATQNLYEIPQTSLLNEIV